MFIPKQGEHAVGMLSDPELCNRIRNAPLPTTRDGREFARALALADDMPMSDAREVEREYRRFLYLSLLGDDQILPPAPVRLAWQMHAQSRGYERFCREVLGRPLPVADGSRNLGATQAYLRTKKAYKREFGERPPRLIWPERITPRLPRWAGAHMAVLGLTGTIAYGEHLPAVFAIGAALSLALYGLDRYFEHRQHKRRSLGSKATDDLSYFLHNESGH